MDQATVLGTSPETPVERCVVLVADAAGESAMLAKMLQESGVPALLARDPRHAVELIRSGVGAILVSEEMLDLSEAEEAKAILRAQPAWSDVPVLITTAGGSERLNRLLETTAAAPGSVTLLERPIRPELLRRSALVALNARRRQYELRRLLEEQRRREVELRIAKEEAERELAERTHAEAALGSWASQPLPHEARSLWVGFAFAAVALGIAVLVRWAFVPTLGNEVPFPTLFAAVAVVVWLGGVLPAIATAVVGYPVCHVLFMHGDSSPLSTVSALGLYGVGVGLIISIGARMRSAQANARRNARLALERQRYAERALAERDAALTSVVESEERLLVAVKNAKIILWQSDRDLRCIWLQHPDPTVEPATVLGRREDEFLPSADLPALMDLKRRVLETGQGATMDITTRRAGRTRTYQVAMEPMHDKLGAVIGITSVALDVTERKHVEDALRASDERAREQLVELNAIYSAAPLGITVLDTKLRYRRINKLLADANGFPIEAHIGRTVSEIVPSVGEQAEEVMRRVLTSGEPVRFEFKGDTCAEPGVQRIWDEHWFPLRDRAGAILGVAAIVEDVTERRAQERALRESEELFRALAENVPQLTWMAQSDGTVFWFNRRWHEYIGAPGAQMTGWGWLSAHHPEHVERVAQSYRNAVTTGLPWEDTFPLRGNDGLYRWFLSRAFPIRDAEGRIQRWFGANTDITVLRETQEALAAAQQKVREYAEGLERTVMERTAKLQETVQELEAFSYSIAHDMRAPLRSMIGYAELVCEEHAEGMDDEGRDYLKRITISARRLDRLIQDVLNYSRIVRDELPREPVDTRLLVEEVLDSYPSLNAVKDRVRVDLDLPLVLANRSALTQVFSNLLENAVKFVPKNSLPAIRVFSEPSPAPRRGGKGAWTRICVEDNGIGIDPTVRPRLFQMFQRFTRPGLYEGTGIGLAITRKAVDRMGGTIGVDSTAAGGSRFWFVLPAFDASGELPFERS